MPIFLIFLIFPILELMLFLRISAGIGLLSSLLLCVLTAIAGSALVKHQGLQTFMRMRGALDRGQIPSGEIFDGFCLAMAGALLITPGFISDTMGFLLLVPKVRYYLRNQMSGRMGWSSAESTDFYEASSMRRRPDADTIEGEFERVDEPQAGENPQEAVTKRLDRDRDF